MSVRERLLLRRLRDRDERAFRELVKDQGDRVYRLLFRMIGNAEDAEDLTQEVFIAVFKSIDSFRGEASFSTWLYRIAVNHCKNRIQYLARRRARSQIEFDDRIDSSSLAVGSLSAPREAQRPDQQLAGLEMEIILQEAIESLEEDQRLLVVLRDIEDLTYSEICEITGLAAGTLKSRLHRARLALRKKLAKYV